MSHPKHGAWRYSLNALCTTAQICMRHAGELSVLLDDAEVAKAARTPGVLKHERIVICMASCDVSAVPGSPIRPRNRRQTGHEPGLEWCIYDMCVARFLVVARAAERSSDTSDPH